MISTTWFPNRWRGLDLRQCQPKTFSCENFFAFWTLIRHIISIQWHLSDSLVSSVPFMTHQLAIWNDIKLKSKKGENVRSVKFYCMEVVEDKGHLVFPISYNSPRHIWGTALVSEWSSISIHYSTYQDPLQYPVSRFPFRFPGEASRSWLH